MSLFAHLPADRLPAVLDMLERTFGDAPIIEGDRLAGGSAVAVLRFSVAQEHYVLRVEAKGPLQDVPRQYACMAIAAEGGIAPPIIATDPKGGLCVIRYIAPKLGSWAPQAGGRLGDTARLVRRMHDLPLFPKAMPYREAIGFMMGAVRSSPLVEDALKALILDLYDRVDAAYPWDGELVSGHQDLNPANFVWDGERHWIVDWEMAFASDRYGDLATLCNWLTSNDAQENEVLEAYFDRPATDAERARLFQMRQLSRLVYGALLVMSAPPKGEGPPLTQDVWNATPTINDLRGEMSALAVYGGRLRFGTAFLKDAVALATLPAA